MGKFYITTAIPYVNDKPHLGHAILHLYADVLARYHRQIGDTTLFSAGTDEHGGKIAEAAAKLGMEPKAFVDEISEKFRTGLSQLGISNDRFVRTTDTGHEQRAQLIWKNLSKDFYKKSYVGMYCVGCEEFKTDTVVKETNGVCPNHNRPYEEVQEENYFFKLSAYTEQILQAIEAGTFKIVPENRKNEIISVLREGLEDISISRPKGKINWGIPVPGDPTQVLYVWFEALMNYITVIGYPEHADFAAYWPADVQVIGKDILRFHAAIWPGMLLGLGLPLPKNLYVHGFVTSNGQKMSKTLGNVVDPLDVVEQFGLDAFRYYFLKYGPCVNDVDFTWVRFEQVYNSELGNELGNALQRTAAMITKYQNGVIGDTPPPPHDTGEFVRAIADFRFDAALELVWDQVRGLNQYIDTSKPWEIAKIGDIDHLREVLAYAVSCLLEIAEMLTPFLPDTAAAIQNTLGSGIVKSNGAVLFPRIEKYTLINKV